MNTSTLPSCSQCGSELLLVSTETKLTEGSRFEQTTVIYKCTNQPCQDRIDSETKKRLKTLEDKRVADERRMNLVQQKRRDIRLQKTAT